MNTYFKNRVYPRINPDTYELEWYVMKSIYDSISKKLVKENLADPVQQDNNSDNLGD
jgi:hypothetical protein